MINVLAIDTSTNYVMCGIATLEMDGTIQAVAQREVDNFRGHMELLVPNIQECLAEAKLQPADLHCVVVGRGPGPFTGLRVGMATGAAFADALNIPLHAVPSMEATAWHEAISTPIIGSHPRDLVVLADARRREWYHAHYRLRPGPMGLERDVITAPRVASPDVVLADLDDNADVLAAAGVAAAVERDLVSVDAHPTTVGLICAAMAAEHSVVGLLRTTEPARAMYLRRPDAVVPRLKPLSQAVDTAVVATEELASSQRYDEPGDGGGDLADAEISDDQVHVRPITEADVPAVVEMEKELFSEESPWPEAAVRQTIGNPLTMFLGVYIGHELVGYAVFVVLGTMEQPECELQNMAVRPEHQGKGYSRLLMDQLVGLADRIAAPIFLEVRTDNEAAVGLYNSYTFQVEGTRKGYYQPSGADAYTMQRPVTAVTTLREPEDGEQLVLGVESSCDETGVGIISIRDGQLEVLADQVASSMEQHARFGGVVPEVASRAHLEAMQPVMHAALRQAAIARPTAVAATIGPGLAGALLVGAAAAKAYAAAWDVPFYAVNHLGGHVAVGTLVDGVDPSELDNAIALLVSGGHTQILRVNGVGQAMEEMGSTLDDAAGEAYDKVARLLGLGYPGGPIIDRVASQGDPKAIAFPRGMMRPQDSRYDFSFSGLKTSVARYVEKAEKEGQTIPVEDLCASFQEAVVDVLLTKTLRACEDMGAKVVLLGGGVSANKQLRQQAEQRCQAAGVRLHVPPLRLCTDNGVMVAALASNLIMAGARPSALNVGTDPSLDVETPLVN